MATQTIARGSATFGTANGGDTFLIQGGGGVITGNLDYSGVTTSVIGEIAQDFSGSIGSSAASWLTAFSSRLVYAGGGELWWESDSSDTETTALFQHIGAGASYLTGDGIVTRCEQVGGLMRVSNGVTLITARFGGNATALLLDTGTGPAITTLDVTGANVTCQRPVTTANAHRGALTFDCDGAGGVNAVGTLNVNGAAVTLIDVGTISQLNWNTGTINASKLTRLLTITASSINMSLPGATTLLNNPLITFSSNTKLYTDGRQL